MTKKTLLYPLYFLLVFFMSHVSADTDDDNEGAFYALSSLRFHLEEELWNNAPEFDSDKISFSETDVTNLWQRAAASQCSKNIIKAQSYYQRASTASPSDHRAFLLKAKQIVDNAWEEINPAYQQPISKGFENHRYILSADHWLKTALDGIFTDFDAQKDHKTFKKAGFEIICKRTSDMIVAKHKLLPGYIIKIYLLEDKPEQSWKWMSNRCEGAENVRNLIKKKDLKHFIAPDKWIYQLPAPLECKGTTASLIKQTSHACLVCTRMNILSYDGTRRAWKEIITHAHLRELYCILSHGFASTYIHGNIPYTKEGKFACLDTEIPYRRHKYDKVNHYLSPEMRVYWDILVKTGGRP